MQHTYVLHTLLISAKGVHLVVLSGTKDQCAEGEDWCFLLVARFWNQTLVLGGSCLIVAVSLTSCPPYGIQSPFLEKYTSTSILYVAWGEFFVVSEHDLYRIWDRLGQKVSLSFMCLADPVSTLPQLTIQYIVYTVYCAFFLNCIV